jgi:putative flippase GtrA
MARAQWRQALGFALVGCAGFGTDALLFLLLSQGLGLPVFGARALAFVPATLVTWLLNRSLVFRTQQGPRRKREEYLRHLGVQSIGIAINFASFWAAVEAGLGRHSANLVPLAIGSLVAMVFNYLASRRFVYLA